MNRPSATPPTAAERRRRRRVAAALLSLGGLALAGCGIAATSAAWTDTVHLSAQGGTATANLQGSIDGGTTWKESSNAGAVELTFANLTNLTPGDASALPFKIKNSGTVAIAITGAATLSGQLFTPVTGVTGCTASGTGVAAPAATTGTATMQGCPVSAAFSTALPATIPAGGTIDGVITLTDPAWSGSDRQGLSGTVTIAVNGSVA